MEKRNHVKGTFTNLLEDIKSSKKTNIKSIWSEIIEDDNVYTIDELNSIITAIKSAFRKDIEDLSKFNNELDEGEKYQIDLIINKRNGIIEKYTNNNGLNEVLRYDLINNKEIDKTRVNNKLSQIINLSFPGNATKRNYENIAKGSDQSYAEVSCGNLGKLNGPLNLKNLVNHYVNWYEESYSTIQDGDNTKTIDNLFERGNILYYELKQLQNEAETGKLLLDHEKKSWNNIIDEGVKKILDIRSNFLEAKNNGVLKKIQTEKDQGSLLKVLLDKEIGPAELEKIFSEIGELKKENSSLVKKNTESETEIELLKEGNEKSNNQLKEYEDGNKKMMNLLELVIENKEKGGFMNKGRSYVPNNVIQSIKDFLKSTNESI